MLLLEGVDGGFAVKCYSTPPIPWQFFFSFLPGSAASLALILSAWLLYIGCDEFKIIRKRKDDTVSFLPSFLKCLFVVQQSSFCTLCHAVVTCCCFSLTAALIEFSRYVTCSRNGCPYQPQWVSMAERRFELRPPESEPKTLSTTLYSIIMLAQTFITQSSQPQYQDIYSKLFGVSAGPLPLFLFLCTFLWNILTALLILLPIHSVYLYVYI